MDLQTQSLAADYKLAVAYEAFRGPADVGLVAQMLSADLGPNEHANMYPETPTTPMHGIWSFPTCSVILTTGVNRLSHCVEVAQGYLFPNASHFSTGCNSAAADYAGLVWGRWTGFPNVQRRNVIVFGNSLGGMAAQILTRQMRIRLGNVRVRCCTTGTPKTFKSDAYGVLSRDLELNWCNQNDPFPSLLPLLQEFVTFYAFLPAATIYSLLQFTHRCELIYLRDDGFTPFTVPNPWQGIPGPTNLPALIWHAYEAFTVFHSSSTYRNRLGMLLDSTNAGGTGPRLADPEPIRRVRTDRGDLIAAGINPNELPRGNEIPIENSGGTNDVRTYRIKRRGYRYLLLRGSFSLGPTVSKSAARFLARQGNRMMRPTPTDGAPDPYVIDEALRTGFPSYWQVAAPS